MLKISGLMYEEHLTKKSIFFSWQTLILLFAFFAIRFLSYYLQGEEIIQALIIFCLIMLLGILYFKNPDWALYLVIMEMFLGGSGHFLEFVGLSIRTMMIGFYLFLWLADQIGNHALKQKININSSLGVLLIVFCVFLFLSAVNGFLHNNSAVYIIQNIIPYFFLILLFPSFHIFQDERTQRFLVRNLLVFIIGSAFLSLAIFIFYSGGFGALQDGFYHWYRDIALGKITNIGNGFFRIVEPEHLLLVPFILILTSLLMRDEKHHIMWRIIAICALIPLAINLSRGYFLALAIGLLVLKYKHRFHRWLIVSLSTLGILLLIFITLSLLASQGQTMGLELLGIRIISLTNPQIEISTATRMMILPNILEIIKNNPLLGAGLGSTVTFFNSLIYDQVTTRQFDWGYLQMWVELGLFGLLSFLSIVFFAISRLMQKIRSYADYHDFDVGLLAGLIAFLIINITAPALFHIFGIVYIIFASTIALKPDQNTFQRLIDILYQVFRRLKEIKNQPSA